MPEAKALVWVLAWAYLSEPLLLANVISSKIFCVGTTICIKYKTLTFHDCDSISTLNYLSINCCAMLDKFARGSTGLLKASPSFQGLKDNEKY